MAGRFGNAGQADYSAANDFMCKVCSSLNGSRDGVLATALDWSAWGGIGMATRGSVPEMMRRAGIEMLDPKEATPLVRDVLAAGARGEYVVGRELGVLLESSEVDGGIDRAAVTRLAEARCGLPVTSVTLDKHTGLTLSLTIDPKKEPFLRDHMIDGTAVLPGVMGLELFAQAATLLSQGSRVEAIENIEFAAPFKFYRQEPRTAVIRVLLFRDLEGRTRARCALQSSQVLAGGLVQEKEHFSAEVLLAEASTSPLAGPVATAPSSDPGSSLGAIEGGAIYRVYFHGPAYQVLSRVDLPIGRSGRRDLGRRGAFGSLRSVASVALRAASHRTLLPDSRCLRDRAHRTHGASRGSRPRARARDSASLDELGRGNPPSDIHTSANVRRRRARWGRRRLCRSGRIPNDHPSGDRRRNGPLPLPFGRPTGILAISNGHHEPGHPPISLGGCSGSLEPWDRSG